MISCWSVKGGSGTSVVTALLALAIARKTSTVLVDVDGDQPAIFGLTDPAAGFRDWWQSGLGGDALLRLAVAVSPALRLVGAGDISIPFLDREFDCKSDVVTVFDVGTVRNEIIAAHVVEASDTSLLITRPCYLAARRASSASLRIDGLIVVEERGRVLQAKDLAEVVGAPVLATLPWDSSIARIIDAGRLGNRVPRAARNIEDAVDTLLDGLRDVG